MAINWKVVTSSHIRRACTLFSSGQRAPARPAKTTFLVISGRRYPAKFIRGLAYELATGVCLNPSVDYSGGAETATFFTDLGFEVDYQPGVVPAAIALPLVVVPPSSPRLRDKQKQALYDLLRKKFGDGVQVERTFDWLAIPKLEQIDDELRQIYDAIAGVRGVSGFSKPSRRLACDFFVPALRLIVEYDERQHFTRQRAASLRAMPPSFNAEFDRGKWIVACDTIKAVDLKPPQRDETRAWYDSVRDVLIPRNGYRLVRIRKGIHDWTETSAAAVLARYVDSVQKKGFAAMPQTQIQRVGLVVRDYNVRGADGRWDCSDYVAAINRLCDEAGCDTILYSLYTWDSRSATQRSPESLFRGCKQLLRTIMEVGPLSDDVTYPDLEIEVWTRGRNEPVRFKQTFAELWQRSSNGNRLMADLPNRHIANGLVLVCGETNIVAGKRGQSGIFEDDFQMNATLAQRGIDVVLNPIHDHMGWKMVVKRGYLSRDGRVVISVWNEGKGREAFAPWTVFADGQDVTGKTVRELEIPVPARKDIRIGIVDVEEARRAT